MQSIMTVATNFMIFEKVRRVISEILVVAESNISLESRLRQDLGADSLDEVLILYGVEECCAVDFDDLVISRFRTVGDIVKLIHTETRFKD